MRMRDLLPRRVRGPLGAAGRRAFAALAGPLQPAVAPGSVVVLCHCHYPDLVPELARLLRALPRGAAVHVSSADPAVFSAWERRWRGARAPIRFHPTENRGRDLLPFITVARSLDLAPDAVVLKVHGKRSAYTAAGSWWRRDTLRSLLPGPFAVRRILARFAADPRLALLGAPGSVLGHPVYWGRNRDNVAALMCTLTGAETHDEDLAFVAGSMFWIRGAYLSALLPRLDPTRFEPEPIGQDGSYAHAVERVIGLAALAWGWHIGEVDVPEPLSPDAVRHRRLRYL